MEKLVELEEQLAAAMERAEASEDREVQQGPLSACLFACLIILFPPNQSPQPFP